MSTYNTDLDEINHICCLVEEIKELTYKCEDGVLIPHTDLIRSKASTIKRKAQKMENRLKEYKSAIESLGFKRVKSKKK